MFPFRSRLVGFKLTDGFLYFFDILHPPYRSQFTTFLWEQLFLKKDWENSTESRTLVLAHSMLLLLWVCGYSWKQEVSVTRTADSLNPVNRTVDDLHLFNEDLFFQDKISNHLQLVMLENYSHCSEPHKTSSYIVSSGTSKIEFENAGGSELVKITVGGKKKISKNSSRELLASIRCKRWG